MSFEKTEWQPAWAPPLAVRCDVCKTLVGAKEAGNMGGWLLVGLKAAEGEEQPFETERHACPKCAAGAYERATAALVNP